MPVILATQEAVIRRIAVPSQPREIERYYCENAQHKKGLAEWLKWLRACTTTTTTTTKVKGSVQKSIPYTPILLYLFTFAVLGFELRASRLAR
jgi:hypothetical protein